jgi:hypothetical protein
MKNAGWGLAALPAFFENVEAWTASWLETIAHAFQAVSAMLLILFEI